MIDGNEVLAFNKWWAEQDANLNVAHRMTAWNAWLARSKSVRPEERLPGAAETFYKQRALALEQALRPFVDGFTYDPGHSDLDNEQPIHVGVALGDWRKASFVLRSSTPQNETPK